MKRAIHLFPHFENMNLIQTIRKTYDPLYQLIDPHITICFPFDSSLTNESLKQHIETALKDVQPFQIRLSGITAHQNEYLFLNVKKGNDHMIQLHDCLYSGILETFRDRRYTYFPHLTVGRVRSVDEISSAMKMLSKQNAVFEATISQISVERIAPDDSSIIEFVHRFDQSSQ